MTHAQITFDKLAYIDRLKTAGVGDGEARAQAEALDTALRDTVVTKQDLHLEIGEVKAQIGLIETRLELLGRDLTIRMGGIAVLLFGALTAIKYFG